MLGSSTEKQILIQTLPCGAYEKIHRCITTYESKQYLLSTFTLHRYSFFIFVSSHLSRRPQDVSTVPTLSIFTRGCSSATMGYIYMHTVHFLCGRHPQHTAVIQGLHRLIHILVCTPPSPLPHLPDRDRLWWATPSEVLRFCRCCTTT